MFPIEEIEKIAALASLELTGEEKLAFSRQFEDILNYFKLIDSAPTGLGGEARERDERTPPTGGPLFREDVAVQSGVSPQDFSPYLQDGHFKVPRVIE